MYIFKNAFRCIKRAKGRNLLIGVVVLLLSVSSCLGLSIKRANYTLKKQYQTSMKITGTLNSKNMKSSGSLDADTLSAFAEDDTVKDLYLTASLYFAAGDDIEPLDVSGSFKQNKDFKAEFGDIKSGDKRTTTSSEVVSGTSYKTTLNPDVQTLANTGSNDLEEDIQSEISSIEENSEQQGTEPPVTDGNEESDGTESALDNGDESSGKSTKNSSDRENDYAGNDMPSMPSGGDSDSVPQMPSGDGAQGQQFNNFITNNQYFFNMASMNDFTLTACNNLSGFPEYITDLGVLTNDSTESIVIISQNLADENSFSVDDTFTLVNPDNDDESYTFKIGGIYDSSESTEGSETSSNASFADNVIYCNMGALESIVSASVKLNPEDSSDDTEDSDEDADKSDEEESAALTPTYSGTFIFANLNDFNTFSGKLSDDYTLVSEDVQNYEQSTSQLETLGKYATYFLIVIFIIGAFVLIIINLFSIRDRKFEIGVLTAIGMKKGKVALQFVTELFVITFIALIIGSCVGASVSVPVTNSLLTTINSSDEGENVVDKEGLNSGTSSEIPGEIPSGNMEMPSGDKSDGDKMGSMESIKSGMQNIGIGAKSFVASVNSATDITVILQMIVVGLCLTLISALAAVIFVMRYEPLKILSNRD